MLLQLVKDVNLVNASMKLKWAVVMSGTKGKQITHTILVPERKKREYKRNFIKVFKTNSIAARIISSNCLMASSVLRPKRTVVLYLL